MARLRGEHETRPSRVRGIPVEPRRPPSPPDLFEFVHVVDSDMCAAEDVFFRGQLLPYKVPPTSPAPIPVPISQLSRTAHHGLEHRRCPADNERQPSRHRRADSLDGYERSRAGDGRAASRYWKGKGSQSADYQRLRPVAEECDARAASRGGATTSPRPKWYVLVFGSVKVPAEMDMKDIRSRLRRRSTSPSAGSGGGGSGRADASGGLGCSGKTGGGGGGGAWKLLRSLSCKGDVGGVAEAPLSYALT